MVYRLLALVATLIYFPVYVAAILGFRREKIVKNGGYELCFVYWFVIGIIVGLVISGA